MRALACRPGVRDSVELISGPAPEPGPGDLVVDAIAVGICGTDREIAAGEYGLLPPGRDRLILGHESLGRVRHAPEGTGFRPGDLVVGIVRRPDPEPCGACAHGEFDMCRNGRYTERGIWGQDGYAATTWTVAADYAVAIDPELADAGVLLEPASVVAKAWEQIERIGARAWFEPRRVLVTGAGPIGLLAALLGRRRGLDVHVLDRVTDGPKPGLVRRLGAEYHADPVAEVAARVRPDIVVEATGAGAVVLDAMAGTEHYGITCLTGVSTAGRAISTDAGSLNRSIVLENDVVVGSVNANHRHYAAAADALRDTDRSWLADLITRRVPLDRWQDAFVPAPHDVKVVVELS
jgi:glucose 1-dehydrogenase